MKINKKIVIIMKGEFINKNYIVECVDINSREKLLLTRSPKLKTKLSRGVVYEIELNQNWINKAEINQTLTDLHKPNPENSNKRKDIILAQCCLKACGNISNDIIELKNNTLEIYNWMEETFK